MSSLLIERGCRFGHLLILLDTGADKYDSRDNTISLSS
jgi:hypothetical protein